MTTTDVIQFGLLGGAFLLVTACLVPSEKKGGNILLALLVIALCLALWGLTVWLSSFPHALHHLHLR